MNETTLDEIMKCSKEAIARAYMCRAYVTVPIGKCPDPYCRVRECKTLRECKTCGRVHRRRVQRRAEADRDGARHVFRHSRDAGHGINPR